MARATMLAAAGVMFVAVASLVDEEQLTSALIAKNASPERIADALAEVKAVKVSWQVAGLVLGADQVLITANGIMLDKPDNRVGGEAQLRRLANTEHRLIAATIIAEDGVVVWRVVDMARLQMRLPTDYFTVDYLDGEGDTVLGDVGTYRIESVEPSYSRELSVIRS